MPSKKSKLIPITAGLFILFILAGFSLGIRTVIEFDPVNVQMKTSKYIFLHLPIYIHKQSLWFADESKPESVYDWQLMHEFHHSAAGSEIEHTHWGSFADTIILWASLGLEPDARARLAESTLELIADDMPIKSKRIYALRIDSQLKLLLAQPNPTITPETIDTLIEAALSEPIDAQASMIPDP